MNKLETAEAVKVMQAYVDGEEIGAYRDSGERLVIIDDEPSWNWGTCEYHIKPREPREFIIYHSAFSKTTFAAIEDGDIDDYIDAIKVREVLDETM